MIKTMLMVIVFFLFHCGFNGNACRLSISKCHLVEKRRFDRFGLYQVDKMVINPLGAAEPPPSNITIAGLNIPHLDEKRHIDRSGNTPSG